MEPLANEKNVIALSGRSNCGKTQTLNALLDLLLQNGGLAQFGPHRFPAGDRWCVLELDGKRIGLTTRGDKEEVLKSDFKKMGDCDFYICAAHPQGGTKNFLRRLTSKGRLLWIGKATLSSRLDPNPETLFQEISDHQAKHLLETVKLFTNF